MLSLFSSDNLILPAADLMESKADSKETAIDFVARKLAVDYLSPTGKFHNGYDLASVNKKY